MRISSSDSDSSAKLVSLALALSGIQSVRGAGRKPHWVFTLILRVFAHAADDVRDFDTLRRLPPHACQDLQHSSFRLLALFHTLAIHRAVFVGHICASPRTALTWTREVQIYALDHLLVDDAISYAPGLDPTSTAYSCPGSLDGAGGCGALLHEMEGGHGAGMSAGAVLRALAHAGCGFGCKQDRQLEWSLTTAPVVRISGGGFERSMDRECTGYATRCTSSAGSAACWAPPLCLICDSPPGFFGPETHTPLRRMDLEQ
ncbi:hypothetical protein B0H11DRAFT_2257394 [Mycena galericulata]|nr:hypothetical protein B0H11DRAFT_2257394 [Mycena galericulata]